MNHSHRDERTKVHNPFTIALTKEQILIIPRIETTKDEQFKDKENIQSKKRKMATIRRLSDDDVRAVFEALHNNTKEQLPPHLHFSIVPVGPDGLKLSPPSYEFEGKSIVSYSLKRLAVCCGYLGIDWYLTSSFDFEFLIYRRSICPTQASGQKEEYPCERTTQGSFELG
jgi:hypothetical protein